MEVTVYHYTDEEGRAAIRKSRKIKMSQFNGVDAAFGEGVYLTKMSPSEGKKVVAVNNWKQAWKTMVSNGRLDYVIQLRIPSQLLQEAPSGRNIYIHENDILLDEYTHEFFKCDWEDDDDDGSEKKYDKVVDDDDSDESEELTRTDLEHLASIYSSPSLPPMPEQPSCVSF